MKITDAFLDKERPHPLSTTPHIGWNGVQRLYRFPNGYGLSAVNVPALHSYPFAWEIAVVKFSEADPERFEVTYDTPLTQDVEVFDTVEDANAFIDKAIAWGWETA